MGNERTQKTGGDLDTETATTTITTPIGGGTATGTLTFSNLREIGVLLDFRITALDPTGVEVDAPQVTVSGNQAGITVNSQSAGTTVSVSATAIE